MSEERQKPRIRVRLETGLSLDDAEKAKIKDLAGLSDSPLDQIEFTVETYSTREDSFLNDFDQRMEILDHALIAMTDSFPSEQKDMWTRGLHRISENYRAKIAALDEGGNHLHDIKPYQQVYTDYLSKLRDYLMNDIGMSQKAAEHMLDECDQFYEMQQIPDIHCTVSHAGMIEDGTRIRMEVPQGSLHPQQQADYLAILNSENKLPTWYTSRSPAWQNFFKQTLENIGENRIRDGNIFISSRGEVAGTRNHWMHVHAEYDGEGMQLGKVDRRFRSSHIGNRPFMRLSAAAQEREAAESMSTVAEKSIERLLANIELEDGAEITLPLLAQTLITPLPIPGKPDRALNQLKAKALERLAHEYKDGKTFNVYGKTVKVKLNIINTNHALNPGRYATPVIGRKKLFGMTIFKGTKSAREGYKLIKAAQAQAKTNPLLANAVKDYEELLDRSAFLSYLKGDSNRELVLAALEQIIVSEMGGVAYGSCVSGKDRKGLETIYTDAMREHYNQYGKLPNYYDKGNERLEFNKIFADMYITRHDHRIAGLNAPGANGIKTPYLYLPKDLCHVIKQKLQTLGHPNPERALKDSDRLASNNEPHKVLRKAGVKPTTPKQYDAEMEDLDVEEEVTPGSTFVMTSALAGANPQPISSALTIAQEVKEKTTQTKLTEAQSSVDRAMDLIEQIVSSPEWQHHTASLFSGAPRGVAQLSRAVSAGESIQELGRIAEGRIKVSTGLRSENTQSLYRAVNDLAKHPEDTAAMKRLEELGTAFQPGAITAPAA